MKPRVIAPAVAEEFATHTDEEIVAVIDHFLKESERLRPNEPELAEEAWKIAQAATAEQIRRQILEAFS